MKAICHLILLAVLLGCLQTAAISAQTQPDNPPPLVSILLLLDQSGSMGGQTFGHTSVETPNDPLNLRFEAAQYVAQTLAAYRALLPEGARFQLSAIHFGDEAELALDWQTIDDDWHLTTRASVLEALSATTFGPRNLSNTNFIAAYELAQAQFARVNRTAFQEHLGVIITLTDGEPCAPTHPNWRDQACLTPSDGVRHMRDLADLTLQNFPPGAFQLYVVAIDSNAQGYWDRYDNAWQTVVRDENRAITLNDARGVGPAFLQILSEVVATLRADSESGLAQARILDADTDQVVVPVEPYSATLRLTIFKEQATPSRLQVQLSNGQEAFTGAEPTTVEGGDNAIEIWTFEQPPPGQWSLRSSTSQRLEIFYDLIPAELQIDFPNDITQAIAPFQLIPLELRAVTPQGTTLRPYPDTRLALQAEVVLQNEAGQRRRGPLTPQASGLYNNTQLRAETEGPHRLSLIVRAPLLDGQTREWLRQPNAGAFYVDLPLLDVSLGLPNTPKVGDAMTVTSRLLDDTGRPVAPPLATVRGTLLKIPAETEQPPQTITTWTIAGGANHEESVTLPETGNYQIRLEATAARGDGREPLLFDSYLSEAFVVTPHTWLSPRIISPRSGTEWHLTSGFPPENQALMLEVDLNASDESDPISLVNDPDDVLRYAFVTADANQTFADDVPLSYDPITQTWQTSFTPEATGCYQLIIEAQDAALAADGRFDPATRSTRTRFCVTWDPWLLALYGGAGLVTALMLLAILAYLVYRWRLRQNPLKGYLILTFQAAGQKQATDYEIKLWPLTHYRRNTITLRGKKLKGIDNIPLKWVRVHQTPQKTIHIAVKLKNQRLKERPLRPRERLLVYETPDTEQYFLHFEGDDEAL